MIKLVKKKRKLTEYGKWLKLELIKSDWTAVKLADEIGISPQRITDMMYGAIPGNKYRSQIENALGAKPPKKLQNVS